ncbi:MAG: YEATS-associated helix-containing protein [Flavobacteriaceae bacterium]
MDTLDIEKIDTVLIIINDVSKYAQSNTTSCHNIWTIIILILLTGFLGGLVNYFAGRDSKENTQKNFLYDILLGVIGASLVPLFFQLTSSKLLDNCEQCDTTFLVLGGYMLIASIFSKRLIDNLGRKIFDIEDVKKEIEKAQTEPLVTGEELTETDIKEIKEKIKEEPSDLTQTEKDKNISNADKILANMQGSRYKFRTLNGIAKSTQLDKNKVFVIINILKSKNIIEEVTKNSNTYYKLTERGESLRLIK